MWWNVYYTRDDQAVISDDQLFVHQYWADNEMEAIARFKDHRGEFWDKIIEVAPATVLETRE